MGKSYYPKSDAAQSAWAGNYKVQIAIVADALGLTPEQVTKQTAICDKIVDSINNTTTKRANLRAAIGNRNDINATDGGALRADISNIKTLPGYNVGIGNALGIISPTTSADYAGFKPVLTIDTFGGKVQIRFKKMETDGINIYRKKGDAADWKFVARSNKSPYYQAYTLEAAGMPELWQYRAFGAVDDNEVGQPSDIVQII